ncbi:MAG TPA: ABC transporter substrate-binding protein [Spirochaetia bacterium]
MPRSLTFLLCGALCAALVSCATPGPRRETGPITIGFFGDLSTTGARSGNEALRGVMMRLKEVNAAGGVSGRQMRLVVRDVKQSATEAVKAFTALAQDENACAIIGAPVLNAGLAVSPVADLSRVPFVSLSLDDRVTTPEWKPESPDAIGPLRRYSFLVQPTGALLSAGIARYAMEHFSVKKMAVIYDSASTLSILQARAFERAVKTGGGTLVASQELQPGNESAPLSAITAAGADALFVCCGPGDAVEVVRAMRGMSVRFVLLGSQGWYDPTVAAAGDATTNAWLPLPLAPDDPGLSRLASAWVEAYGEKPRVGIAGGWDAVGLIVAAIQKQGSASPQLVRDALEQTTGFRGLAWSIDMNRKTHRPAGLPVAIIRMGGGGFQTAERGYKVP